MHKKALTAAIAGALAAPMAAQAVDVSISGHVSRALVHLDSKANENKTQVKDYGSSGSRFRITGSGETMNGMTATVRLEYAAGNGGASPTVRYADVSLGGAFGKLTMGQSDQGGEGSAYSDKSGVTIGHGQETGGTTLGGYFGSLDGGGSRNEVLRYDSPKLGMAGFALSAGNDNQYSAGVSFSGDMGGTALGAKLGYLKNSDAVGSPTTIGLSVGTKLPSGFTLSAAWAKQTVDRVVEDGEVVNNGTDPSFVQSTLGYVFGNSSVGVSWYDSSDFKNKGSDGTMLGIGFKHTMPKAGVDLYATVQTLDVEDAAADGMDTKDTVFVLASRVRF